MEERAREGTLSLSRLILKFTINKPFNTRRYVLNRVVGPVVALFPVRLVPLRRRALVDEVRDRETNTHYFFIIFAFFKTERIGYERKL